MLLALEGLFGEEQPFENKTFQIWLLNSKIFTSFVQVLLEVLLLNSLNLGRADGWGCVLQDPTVAGRRQHLMLGSVHSLPQNFC